MLLVPAKHFIELEFKDIFKSCAIFIFAIFLPEIQFAPLVLLLNVDIGFLNSILTTKYIKTMRSTP